MRSGGVMLAALVALGGSLVSAQAVKYIDGVFVALRTGAPIELIAYAEQRTTGVLVMQRGTMEDVPFVNELVSVLVSVPSWRPHSITITTSEIFRDERAERRSLVFAVSQLNVYAQGLRIVDLERREKIDSLLRAVRASHDKPGYAFFGLVSDGYVRYYPIRLTPLERDFDAVP